MTTVIRNAFMLSGAVVCAQLAVPGVAHAQGRAFDIPPQQLSTAIDVLGRQGGVQIVASHRFTRGAWTRGVRGTMSVQEAFVRLFADTSLVARQISPLIYSVVERGKPAAALARMPATAMVQAATAAPAQAAPPSPPDLPAAQEQTTTAAGAPPSSQVDVVVTGSRVIRNGNNSPTPITVVSVQDLQVIQPTTVAENLNSLPVFSGSRGQFGNPTPTGGNGAANQLNLRNLGANRNLILFDGHRVPPTLTDGSVDVDIIPQLLLQRVDVVTGGVSAVYGSDAISGVVNFVVDKRFNGIKAQAQGGVSQLGDAQQQEIGVAAGASLFGGRGHVEASYEYRNDAGVLNRSSRAWNRQWAVEGAGTAASPYRLVDNVRLAANSFGGLITSGVLAGQNFTSNGVLSPFVHGTPSGTSCCEIGGDGAYYDTSLKEPLRTHQLYGRLDFDVTPDVHFYVNGSADLKRNVQYISPPILQNYTFSATNAFLPATYQAQLAAAKQTTFRMSEFLLQNTPRLMVTADSKQYLVNTGLTGKLGRFDWDASYIRGWTDQKTTTANNPNNQALSAALDAVVNPATGQVVCNVTLTNPGLDPGCVPLNIFGPTAASAAAVNYVLGTTTATAHTTQDDAQASISGQVFSTWAGPVTAALSGEYRHQTFSLDSAITPTTLVDCTGLRYNCTAGASLYQTSTAARGVSNQSVWEGAFEFDAPLVRDVTLFKSFNVNGAVRYTSYKTSGNYVTWKVGADWHVSDDLTLRATKSRDIRAPTLSDLFAPKSVTTTTITDLTPTVTFYNGGNPALTAEIGHTFTAGTVYKPHWLPGFSVSADYYNIRITNAISTVSGTSVAAQTACYASGGASPYCLLQTRPLGFANTTAANVVTSWTTEQLNIASISTHGFDFEVNYAGRIADQPFSLRGFLNYEPSLYFVTPGLPDLEHAGVAYSTNALYRAAKVSATLIAHYNLTTHFGIDVMERWRSPLTMKDYPTQVWVDPRIPAVAYTNLNLTFDVPRTSGNFQLFFNVQNLFDKDPPPAAYYVTQSQPGLYGGWALGDDPIGRYFFAGFRLKY